MLYCTEDFHESCEFILETSGLNLLLCDHVRYMPSHNLQIPGGPKMVSDVFSRRAMCGRPPEVLCSAYNLLYDGMGA